MKVYIGLRQMETYERQALKAKVVDWGMYWGGGSTGDGV